MDARGKREDLHSAPLIDEMSTDLETERARIVAILRLVADRLEKIQLHGVPEPLTFVRSVAHALEAWTARHVNVPAPPERS